MKKWILFALFLVLYALIVYIGFCLNWLQKPLVVSEADLGTEVIVPTVSYLKSQPQYIKDLIWCESRNNPYAIGDGGKARGLLQFHAETLWAYNQRYKVLPDLEKSELPNVWFDEYFQVELAKKIILDGNWENWYNCGRKLNLYEIALKTP